MRARTLEVAHTVDEAKDIRDKALAMASGTLAENILPIGGDLSGPFVSPNVSPPKSSRLLGQRLGLQPYVNITQLVGAVGLEPTTR